MYRHSARIRPLGSLVGFVSLASFTGIVNAGGFALIEHGASGLGQAYAGAAAVSTDTSAVWFNPAGMSQLDGREMAVGRMAVADATMGYYNAPQVGFK